MQNLNFRNDLECKCDKRGRLTNPQDGWDWCWLERSPCTLLTGQLIPSEGKWVRCEYKGATQIAC